MLTAQQQAETAQLFRQVVREVWVVTAAHAGRRGGLTVTWLSAASLDPQRPVVLVGLAPNHATTPLVDASGHFAGHLLAADQAELAWRFASSSSRDVDKFAGLATSVGESGCPRLEDCLARVECRVFHRHETGDRTYFWGEVIEVRRAPPPVDGPSLEPLTDRAFFGGLSADQRSLLIAQLQADLDIQRPLHAAWREPRADLAGPRT
ncbi:MAG: flavin reductase family protein [Pirellulales bacterium]